MRVHYQQQTGIWERPPVPNGPGVVPLEWRQEWFVNVCLMIILAVVTFLMLLSIYMVFSKPSTSAAPAPDSTGRLASNGSPLAQFSPDIDDLPQRIEKHFLTIDCLI